MTRESGLYPSFATIPRLILLAAAFVLLGFGLDTTARAALGPVVVGQVKDIDAGPDDGDPLGAGNGVEQPGGADLNGVLIFSARDGVLVSDGDVHGTELWRSDGTEAGTYMLKDIYPEDNGVLHFCGCPSYFTEMKGEVFFAAAGSAAASRELWKTDGTEAGTVLVKDLNTAGFNSGDPIRMVNVDGTLYFLANSDGVNGYELWKSNGTGPGTEMVRDLEAAFNEAYNLTAIGNQLFFTFNDSATGNGKELWVSDGTFFGTEEVKDINPGPGDGMGGNPYETQAPGAIFEFDGEAYFAANDGSLGLELWRSDGTGPGTEMVKDIRVGADGSLDFGVGFAEFGGELFFSSTWQMHKTDGTELGTERVSPGMAIGITGGPVVVDGVLAFTKDFNELWKSDGTTSGTELVLTTTNFITDYRSFGGNLYFSFDDGTNGTELWRSDLTASGTERLTDINPTGGSLINRLIISGENLYFRGDDDGPNGVELWSASVDVTAPETSIDTGPAEDEVLDSDSATFTFSSNEPGSTFTCTLDGGTPEPCDSGSKTYTGLTEGAHAFSVTATDPAPFSNIDPTPATRNFTYTKATNPPVVDTVAPELRLKARKVQRSPKKIIVKATCLDEACSLVASGNIKVKVLKKNGKVKKTRKLKLKRRRASGGGGEAVRLKVKLNKRAKKLVRKVIRKKASKATVTVRASDNAGNTSKARRRIKLVDRSKRSLRQGDWSRLYSRQENGRRAKSRTPTGTSSSRERPE